MMIVGRGLVLTKRLRNFDVSDVRVDKNLLLASLESNISTLKKTLSHFQSKFTFKVCKTSRTVKYKFYLLYFFQFGNLICMATFINVEIVWSF